MESNYKKLLVWQKAMDLVVLVYEITKNLPKEEIYGLTSQIRRCAVSIPSNIAEGSERKTTGEFKQFLGIAKGSCAELDTQLCIASKLSMIDEDKYIVVNNMNQEILKMLGKLITKV